MNQLINRRFARTFGRLIILFLIMGMCVSPIMAENLKLVKNLEGTWRFTIGDNPEWAMPDYDDRDWDVVYVPQSWEKSGFVDYNGYAWYRKVFDADETLDREDLLLRLGQIDDVDEVYLNGQLIGTTGVFPPLVRTAYTVPRKYPLPAELLNMKGKNVIAVRVYDEYLDGGIYSGPVGIYHDMDNDLLSLNLAGYWEFETINTVSPKPENIYGIKDGLIYVPAFWESLGYATYDGSAVYTKDFRLPARFNTENMMVVVGYVDDVDKVEINGTRVGTVADLRTRDNKDIPDHLILRGYNVPSGTLRAGSNNTITIKVYDTGIMGGIYEGPVGLITPDNYELLRAQQKEKSYNFWDDFFKQIFE
ncbi:MAG: beta galactosidase jelly roll domain-containing protein [bacterium]